MAKLNPESDPEIRKGEDGTDKDESLDGLNSPKIDAETGKLENQAVSSFKQAYAISKRQYDRAEETRLKDAAVIADKYGGSSPYKNATLRATGQGWRSNFSTNPLASVVDRATPQLKDPIKQAESLTYSRLPTMRKDAADKTRKFRRRTTDLIRSWSAWDDFIDQVAQDNYLFGNAAPGWIDDDWRPRAFRYNEVFLPEGTGQHASQAQFVVYRQPMLLHDFLKKLEDKEVAEAAGYDWEGCVKAANEAGGIRNSDSTKSNFEAVDAMREGAGVMGNTYEGETKIVWLLHLLVREYEGGVNLWTTAQKGGHAIRFQKDIHEGMEDAVSLFTLQAGNNRFYGSKGSGRMLCNMHIALDRKRCFDSDKAYVAGLPIFKVKGKDANQVQMSLRAPFMFITGDAEMMQEAVIFDAQAAEMQDQKLVSLMEAIAGAFIPPKLQDSGTPSTKIEAAEKAQRELAVRNGVLGRFFRQFGDLVGAMQRKIYRSENLKEALRIFEEKKEKEKSGVRVMVARLFRWLKDVIPNLSETASPMAETKSCDADAVEAIVDLLEDGLSAEDIAELALSPAANSIAEQPEAQDQKTTEFIAGVIQGPLAAYYNAQKMAAKAGTIAMGEDVAEELLLKGKPDPSDQAINQREEFAEWMAMQQGYPVQAAQTDNHRVRRGVLVTLMKPIIDTLMEAPTPELVKMAEMAVPHYGQHLQMDMETPEADKAEEIKSYQMMEDVVIQAGEQLKKLAEEAAKAGAGGPNDMPPQMPGGANPNVMGDPEGGDGGAVDAAKIKAEQDRIAADLAINTAKIQTEHRKIDLKERELAQKGEEHAQDTMISTAKDVATQAAQAAQAGEQAAREDLARQNEAERAAQEAALRP